MRKLPLLLRRVSRGLGRFNDSYGRVAATDAVQTWVGVSATQCSAGASPRGVWAQPGDLIPLGPGRALRVVAVHAAEPVLLVEPTGPN
jgi:hypothetical protein